MGLKKALLSDTADYELAIHFVNAVDCKILGLISVDQFEKWSETLNTILHDGAVKGRARFSKAVKAVSDSGGFDKVASEFVGESDVRTVLTFTKLLQLMRATIDSLGDLSSSGIAVENFEALSKEGDINRFETQSKRLLAELNKHCEEHPVTVFHQNWFSTPSVGDTVSADRVRDILGLGHLPLSLEDLRDRALVTATFSKKEFRHPLYRPTLCNGPTSYFRALSDEEHNSELEDVKPEGRTVDLGDSQLLDGAKEAVLLGNFGKSLSVRLDWVGFLNKNSPMKANFREILERSLRNRSIQSLVAIHLSAGIAHA